MKIKILDEAAEELDDVFNYYQHEQENLGYRAYQALSQQLASII